MRPRTSQPRSSLLPAAELQSLDSQPTEARLELVAAPEPASEPRVVPPTAAVDGVLAVTNGRDDVDHLTTAFFSQPPASHPPEAWDDAPLPPMTYGARRAMHATLAILGGSLLLLCGYVAYVRLIMPVPVELGRGSSVPPRVAIAAVPSVPVAAVAPLPPHVAAVAPAVPPPVVLAAPSSPPVVAAAPAVPALPPTPASAQASAESLQRQDDPALVASLAAASRLYDHGQRKQARAAYEQVLAGNPNASAALSKLAYIHLDAGDNEQARQYAGRSIAVNPNDSQAWIVLGAARAALGDRKGAREAYRACAALPSGTYTAECRRLAR